MTERWQTIEGFPNYQVSDCGRCRNRKTKNILKLYYDKSNRTIYIGLYRNHRQHRVSLPRIVYQAFGTEELNKNKKVVHLDGDFRNNQIENLGCQTYTQPSEKSYHWKLIHEDGTEECFYTLFDVQKSFKNTPEYRTNELYVRKLAHKSACELVQLNEGVITFRDKKAATEYRNKVLEFVHYCEDKYGSMMNVDESDPKVIEYRKVI